MHRIVLEDSWKTAVCIEECGEHAGEWPRHSKIYCSAILMMQLRHEKRLPKKLCRVFAFLLSYASLDTRILVRSVLSAQTPTRHRWHAIDARIGRDMTSVTQIATPTNFDTDILVKVVKSVFDLRARHAHGQVCVVLAGPYGSAAAIGGFEETVGDRIHPRRQDVRGPGFIEEGIVELAVGEPTGVDAEGRA